MALTAGAREADGEQGSLSRFTISRALAKTITFRVIASTMDFATNYFVVRDVGSALILSASGFILGPFVYFGHEKAWEYFSSRRKAQTSRRCEVTARTSLISPEGFSPPGETC